MNATANVGELAYFTPAVKPLLERHSFSGNGHARLRAQATRTRIGPEEAAFITARDSFHLASIGANGWPYTQYHRGPKGFLRLLDTTTLALGDFRGSRQHISTGKVLIFLMDYGSQGRLRIWAEAEISEDPAMAETLTGRSRGATIDRAFLFHVQAFDWNDRRPFGQGALTKDLNRN